MPQLLRFSTSARPRELRGGNPASPGRRTAPPACARTLAYAPALPVRPRAAKEGSPSCNEARSEAPAGPAASALAERAVLAEGGAAESDSSEARRPRATARPSSHRLIAIWPTKNTQPNASSYLSPTALRTRGRRARRRRGRALRAGTLARGAALVLLAGPAGRGAPLLYPHRSHAGERRAGAGGALSAASPRPRPAAAFSNCVSAHWDGGAGAGTPRWGRGPAVHRDGDRSQVRPHLAAGLRRTRRRLQNGPERASPPAFAAAGATRGIST